MANEVKVMGEDYVLFVNTGTDLAPVWKIALCQTSLTVNTPNDTIDLSSKCGVDTGIIPGQETVEGEGFILKKIAGTSNHISLYQFRQMFRQRKPLTFKAAPKGETEEDDGKIIYDFVGNITNVSDSYPNKEGATCSFSISAIGEIVETEFVFTP